ncbi:hypothetical protein [Verrucosispora sp. WMMC514]|uniref:hypothetical protein n=1 Tax=Verrucosispora sp. WMMC514 TaxID=3015156 RepID=UPI00248B0DD3|nr:hypothetical protein [Verrucosispora sp. WMMC514]WBB89439.1 hypothetical protein O7597_20835 [Verrucosispora sp. WMMC514]
MAESPLPAAHSQPSAVSTAAPPGRGPAGPDPAPAQATAAPRADAAAPARGPDALRRSATLLPWLVVLAVLPIVWWDGGIPVAEVGAFGAYWTLAVVLPGTLVHRALRGSRGNLPEDLGYGAATGLLLELAAWALAAGTGGQHLLRWWPLPVVVVFLAVPRLRRHWRTGSGRRLPLAWHWAICAVLLLIAVWGYANWRSLPLPPADYAYYQDLLYHLGLVHELTRDMPFQLPHLAGEPLRYHYLSDAHIASASMITGVPPATVLLHLWVVPVAWVAALVAAALVRELAGPWWVGPLAAAVGYLGASPTFGSPLDIPWTRALSYGSLSQTYALPLLMLLAAVCVQVLRGRALGPAWVLVPALGLACAGAKSSALPPLIAGLGLAALAAWIRRRRVPWRVFAVLASLVAAMAVGYRLFAGGGAGTLRAQPLGLIRLLVPYQQTYGADEGAQFGGLLPPGLAEADGTAAWLLAAALVGSWLLRQTPRLAGGLLLATPARRDPVAWLFTGAVAAGLTVAWLTYHPSASQIYFWLPVIPFGALLACWLLARIRVRWPVLVATGLLGLLAQLLAPPLGSPPALTRAERAVESVRVANANDWMTTLGWSAARYAALIGLAALLAVAVEALLLTWPRAAVTARRAALVRRLGRPARATLLGRSALAGTVTALLGASIATGVEIPVRHLLANADPLGTVNQQLVVSENEMRAALWLREHTGPDDRVATNVHCRPVRTTPNCDARAYWVTGLGGRRALVESWAYADDVVAAHGRDGHGYPRQPAPDPALFALNEQVFTDPTPTDLARLRDTHRVRWLLADTNAGPVSADLARLAPVRYTAGPVTIHELP